ncbi:MAG: Gfo/Idh/MocA family oxidoreductase [Verrucomicrobiae bacterium]|nr:Gfo/Idh/MocA family oxidoreductase [Verrucomicrobiae bacterium]
MNSDRKSLRVGIAGSGFGLRVLLPVFAGIEGVRVTALAGRERGTATDWRALFSGGDLDAVALALPPLVQEEAAPAALAAGLHVFCEKPLALHPAAAETIVRAAAQRGLVGSVDFEFRKVRAFETVRRNFARVGRPRSLDITCRINARATPPPRGSWKHDVELGGGAMSSFGCHLVDFCSLLLGKLEAAAFSPTVRVSDRASRDGDAWRVTAEDSFVLSLRSVGGALARVELNTVAEKEEGLALTAEGEEGRLLMIDRDPSDYFRGWDVFFEARDGQREKLLDASDATARGGRVEAVRGVAVDFVRSVFYGGVPDSSLEAGAEVVRLVARARTLAASLPR